MVRRSMMPGRMLLRARKPSKLPVKLQELRFGALKLFRYPSPLSPAH
jgi:hypothetical protein